MRLRHSRFHNSKFSLLRFSRSRFSRSRFSRSRFSRSRFSRSRFSRSMLIKMMRKSLIEFLSKSEISFWDPNFCENCARLASLKLVESLTFRASRIMIFLCESRFQDRPNRTGRIEQAEHDRQNRNAITGLSGQDC